MAVTVLLVLGVVAAWSVLIPGVSAWENIIVAVIGSLRLTGPVAAAFAAWVAVRRRRGTGRRPLTTWQAMRAPLAVLVVVTGSFTATVLVLAVRTVLTEQAGRLLPSGLVVGVAGLALYVTIGWVTGWLLPWTITPLFAGLGCYGLFTWLAQAETWADRLAPATREPYDIFQGLSATTFTDQALWLLGVSAALLLGWAALVTRQALVLAGALLAVLAAGTGMARLLTDPPTISAQRVVYSCQEWPITVCVHPGMRTGLPELGSEFVKIASRLAGTPGEFSRLEQRPRSDDGALPPGAIPIHVDDLSSGFADEAADEFVEGLSKECDGTPAGGYRDIVIAWLRGKPLPSGPLPEHQYAAAWFSGLTETQRREWLQMYYADFVGCRLQGGHFGGLAEQTGQTEQTAQPGQIMQAGQEGQSGQMEQPGQAGQTATAEPTGQAGQARQAGEAGQKVHPGQAAQPDRGSSAERRAPAHRGAPDGRAGTVNGGGPSGRGGPRGRRGPHGPDVGDTSGRRGVHSGRAGRYGGNDPLPADSRVTPPYRGPGTTSGAPPAAGWGTGGEEYGMAPRRS